MVTSDELNARNKGVQKGFVGRLLGMYDIEKGGVGSGRPFGVFRSGGSIGSSKEGPNNHPVHGFHVKNFADKEEAKEFAKRRNTGLSQGEKKYYGLKYHVKEDSGKSKPYHDEVDKSEQDELEKGGEGSKGGKVIGHTESGKPIYNNANHPAHKDFTSSEHRDASMIHEDKREKYASSKTDSGFEKFMHHKEQFDQHEEAENHERDKERKQGFDHHRKMAGYHSIKEKELYESQSDLRSSSDKDLHKFADEKEPKRKYHAERTEHHLKTAHELHDPQKHGHWNDTMPSHEDSLKYGEKHA